MKKIKDISFFPFSFLPTLVDHDVECPTRVREGGFRGKEAFWGGREALGLGEGGRVFRGREGSFSGKKGDLREMRRLQGEGGRL